MSVSKKWVAKPENVERVLELYRSRELLTVSQLAERIATSFHNVQHVLKTHMPGAEYAALKAVRKSASKMGSKNPMFGKVKEDHHNWKGLCDNGDGYFTVLHNGKRRLMHRVVMAEALGVEELPEHLDVHHIDGDRGNNALDNLALVTKKGHRMIHYLQVKESKALQLKQQTLAEAFLSTTSP